MRLGRRTRLALKWLQACTSIAAICGLQLLTVPLIACMQPNDDEMNCPGHSQMHAMHSAHSDAHPSFGTHIQCAGTCHSPDLLIGFSEALVPQRIHVRPIGNPVLALVHDNFDPSGFNRPPGVPPPRS